MKKHIVFTLLCALLISFAALSQAKLSSHPSASATVFIDFDGHWIEGSIWNNNGSFYCEPSGLTDEQINLIFHRVSEDFRPFNVNITTDSAVYLKAPLAHRIRVVVTPTSAWYPNVGGVAYTGSFTWGDDTPAFVFSDKLGFNTKFIAECVSHESGHTLGLSHQAKYNGNCALVATYNDGVGTGQIGWAPLMGNSYGRNLSGWNHGPTPYGCTQEQDNLSIITSRNGFTYRVDDHVDQADDTASEVVLNNNLFSSEGIIATNADKDVFKFNINQKGKFEVDILPFSVGPNNEGANLDVKVEILNEDGKQIAEYDPEDILHVSIDTTLTRGVYYVVVSGAANANTSNYGSLGSYTLRGMFSPLEVLPVIQVTLSGKILSRKHELSWNISGEEAIEEIVLEKSEDGNNFASISSLLKSSNKYDYNPVKSGKVYYRIKTTSVNGQMMNSNVIVLGSTSGLKNLFTVSSLVRTDISINAEEDFKFQLSDMSGRMIKKGSGKTGNNQINFSNSPNGIYFIQIISNSQKTTQRIVKL